MQCSSSQHSDAMELLPPARCPLIESERESCIGPQHSGVMKLLPPTGHPLVEVKESCALVLNFWM